MAGEVGGREDGYLKSGGIEETCFNLSTVCRRFGVVGWHTVFWFPKRPTSLKSLLLLEYRSTSP